MYVLSLSLFTRNDMELEEAAKLGPHLNDIIKDISALKIPEEARSLPSNPKSGFDGKLGSLNLRDTVADYIGKYGVQPKAASHGDSDSDATYPPMPGLVSDSDSDSSDDAGEIR
jgi:hypothetical protein